MYKMFILFYLKFIFKRLNDKSNGYIHARELKLIIQKVLNIKISSSRIEFYRHKVNGTNFRRSRFQPKIFSQDEKDLRYAFALNLKDSITKSDTFIDRLISIDESKLQTSRFNFYHNRLPSTYPSSAGIRPRSCKSLNVWAGITSKGPIKPAVSTN